MSRILITAKNEKWARIAASVSTGFATSAIGCPCEAGIDKIVPAAETPDKRPGAIVMFCASKKNLEKVLIDRVGQCILTCPTTAVFDALGEEPEEVFDTGNKMKYFGDGFQKKGEVAGKEVYRIPVMEGEFIIEKDFGAKKGIAGGNFFILAQTEDQGLAAAEAAVEEIQKIDKVILPFPGGICRSGSKVGSLKYKFMHATTNQKYCPTLKGQIEDSELPGDVNSVFEIVINGLTLDLVKKAMSVGIKTVKNMPGIKKITAGNYGGQLGKHFIYLKELV
ncbi:MAG: formylmethanofuran--tetrahydromethanopterin N-formyltransferase [Candidatus Freyarchaeota archaeon]|nr:formylmethanofuran--tetrahydromethanopterin N-formyltransferase [Candidatus Jordarchaeia archaeon]MBS7269483.1 formylmethanofuran--tetrahydromethanopterin N-formyltransferase [Candidatus Jordarchaeia archaeon]MBS7280885.1 formylmethanofuran--tetrahydromethanopterin N-formyltransferase [Candidatus Jordarchaeia archaeon]